MNKITYYQIIEIIPYKLKSEIPLISFIKYFLYFNYLLFSFIKTYFKREKKNEYKINGEELLKNLIVEDEIKGITVSVTKVKFFSIKESEKLLKSLIKEGHSFDTNKLTFPFIIKRKEVFSESIKENKIMITLIYPKAVNTINKYFKGVE
jgi:hypothetical protein